MSAFVRATSREARFSSGWTRRSAPGRGRMSGPWASTKASASCPGEQPFRAAMASNLATSLRLPSKFGAWKRDERGRQSSGPNWARSLIFPATKPRATGVYATKPMPSARTVSKISPSDLRSVALRSDARHAPGGCSLAPPPTDRDSGPSPAVRVPPWPRSYPRWACPGPPCADNRGRSSRS
jgi:hypothetical protein